MQDFDMEVYLQKLLAACQQAFGADLLYMGLQGSWRRGEATEHSDIDVVSFWKHLEPSRCEPTAGFWSR